MGRWSSGSSSSAAASLREPMKRVGKELQGQEEEEHLGVVNNAKQQQL